nr:uncharacterized protein LOC128695683 [Cherax quadricarinatus]
MMPYHQLYNVLQIKEPRDSLQNLCTLQYNHRLQYQNLYSSLLLTTNNHPPQPSRATPSISTLFTIIHKHHYPQFKIINMSRGYINLPDIFCYVCGQFTPSDSWRNITPLLKHCYFAYFGCKLGEQNKPFAPHKACKSCISKLQMWSVRKLKCMPFGVPMVWQEQMNHHDDCYFCMTKVAGFNIIYTNIPSAIRPVPHTEDIPVPVPPETWKISSVRYQ